MCIRIEYEITLYLHSFLIVNILTNFPKIIIVPKMKFVTNFNITDFDGVQKMMAVDSIQYGKIDFKKQFF